jgi:outer membrane lipoprotein-sorting protein
MHRFSSLLLILIVPVCAFGQPNDFVPASDADAVKKQLAAKAAATKSLRCKFIQEKNLQMLSEKIESRGIFMFRQPDKVRMEYTDPFKYLMVINSDRVTIRDGQKTNTFSARSNKMFTLINRVILDCVRGTVFSNKDFSTAIYTRTGKYLVIMKPLKKDLQAFFESIHVYLDATDGTVLQMDMREPSGDNTLITFTEKEINAAIPDTDFVVQ